MGQEDSQRLMSGAPIMLMDGRAWRTVVMCGAWLHMSHFEALHRCASQCHPCRFRRCCNVMILFSHPLGHCGDSV